MKTRHRAGSGRMESGRDRTRRRWCFAAPLAVVLLVAGCSGVVDGTARPAPNLTARSLTGPAIKQVLLGDSALSRILNQSFTIDPRFPPRFGGPETLQDDGSASPVDCLGVASMLQQNVYQSSNVKGVAAEAFRHAARSVTVREQSRLCRC